jgi:Uma2 family endonuclease
VRIPDVTWASPQFIARHGLPRTFGRAPDLCVEVVSPSNTNVEMREKNNAYLAAGAREVWLVGKDGTIEMFDASRPIETSSFGIELNPPR